MELWDRCAGKVRLIIPEIFLGRYSADKLGSLLHQLCRADSRDAFGLGVIPGSSRDGFGLVRTVFNLLNSAEPEEFQAGLPHLQLLPSPALPCEEH